LGFLQGLINFSGKIGFLGIGPVKVVIIGSSLWIDADRLLIGSDGQSGLFLSQIDITQIGECLAESGTVGSPFDKIPSASDNGPRLFLPSRGKKNFGSMDGSNQALIFFLVPLPSLHDSPVHFQNNIEDAPSKRRRNGEKGR
jgi:hypothetical protein